MFGWGSQVGSQALAVGHQDVHGHRIRGALATGKRPSRIRLLAARGTERTWATHRYRAKIQPTSGIRETATTNCLAGIASVDMLTVI